MAQGLTIHVTSGLGAAPTELAAFDRALLAAGIGNYNLIQLSSIIPPGSTIDEKAHPEGSGEWGHRLYVVIASQRTSTPHEPAWAGIGWVQSEDDGRGLFVEHHGTSETQVVDDINASLDDMRSSRPGCAFSDVRLVTAGLTCLDQPVCAVVAAAFLSATWHAVDVGGAV